MRVLRWRCLAVPSRSIAPMTAVRGLSAAWSGLSLITTVNRTVTPGLTSPARTAPLTSLASRKLPCGGTAPCGSQVTAHDSSQPPHVATRLTLCDFLTGVQEDAPDRPPLAQTHTVHIVQDNERSSRAMDPKTGELDNTIQVYSSCPEVELLVNGVSKGKQAVARYMWAEWSNASPDEGTRTRATAGVSSSKLPGFPFMAGNLTAIGYNAAGAIVASHTVQTASTPAVLRIAVDVPSIATGTGEKLVLDGQDTALLRAEVLDSQGRLVPWASNNVTFAVISGPGKVIAVGNGDPTNHQPNRVAWRDAFHGLVRGIVQVRPLFLLTWKTSFCNARLLSGDSKTRITSPAYCVVDSYKLDVLIRAWIYDMYVPYAGHDGCGLA